MGSFSSPLSGLTAAQDQLQTVSNNLANIDTDGYKDQTLTFSDIFAQTSATNGSGDPLQTGSGVAVSSTDSDFTEGTKDTTDVSSNMLISGNGFFVTQSSTGAQDYTRAGDFTTNNAGQLTTPNGELVLGYPAVSGVVNTSAALQPLQVGNLSSPAVASTTMNISANLDADSTVGDTASSSLPVYDSLGTSHTLSVTYTMTAADTWSYNVTIPSSDLTPAGTGATTTVASGTLNFNSQGVLTSVQPTGAAATSDPSAGITITIPPSGTTLADGAAAMPITWNLETAGSPTITQTATASGTSATSTNGFASGTLSNYTVGTDGTIEGTFSSGQTLALGQVAVASFANNQGLADSGNNDYQPTAASGSAVIGVAGTGGRGTVIGGSVEESNVNIASEFAKLIVAQQAYSANAKSITTFNQVSQSTLQMLQ
ncbi:MAG: flagellar hook protein FlgE [Terracidiphilus sp.]|jgi:flagellar hook protein FlgE